MEQTGIDIKRLNNEYKGALPGEIIEEALKLAQRPILTTNFGPYSASLIHAVLKEKKDIQVVWCDTGYNTSYTYKFANDLISLLNINIDIFVPKYTTAFLNSTIGIPAIDEENHAVFAEKVKLEPFRRALEYYKPDVWFTNLRKGQTKYRDGLSIFNRDERGILKVCPFYYYSEEMLKEYLKKHNLPNEMKYFDPTKVKSNRECGIHL